MARLRCWLAARCPCGRPPLQRPAHLLGAALWALEERPRRLGANERLRRRSGARPESPIAQPLVLQASGADGAPCVRYAGGTAPLAALQELAESWETKPGWTLDEQEFAAFLGGPSMF